MVLTAVAMAFQLDIRFQTAIADHLPAALVNPTNSLETSDAVSRSGSRSCARRRASSAPRRSADARGLRPGARVHRQRPLVQHQAAHARGAARPRRAGRLLDLHLHQLHPHAAAPGRLGQGLPRRGADDRRRPLARVHASSARPSNVERAIKQNGIEYPVAQDNELATWNAWSNQYWPAKYLIDANGPRPLRALRRGRLRQDRGGDPRAAASRPGAKAGRRRQARSRRTTRAPQATPETYLGAARARALPARRPQPGHRDLHAVRRRRCRRATSRSAARWKVDRRVRDRRPRRDAARQRHGQGRLPRARRGPGTVDVTRRRQARADRQGHDAAALPPALAARRPARTTCSCASRPASRATPSRSADPNGCRRAGADGSRGRRRNGRARRSMVPMTSLAIETHGLGKRFGDARRAGVDRPGGAARLRVRLPRTQRRRQDDARAAAARARAADVGDDAAARPRPAGRPRRRRSPASARSSRSRASTRT